MIYGKLETIKKYKGIHPNLDKAIDWLTSGTDLKKLPSGRTEIKGDEVYVNRFDYTTKEEDRLLFEAHEAYADLHLLISGEEKICVSHIRDLTEKERKPESDYIGYAGESQSICRMRPDQFLIAFTEDAHKVRVNDQRETAVQKAVVKIKM